MKILIYLALVTISILISCNHDYHGNIIKEGKVIIEGVIQLSENASKVISLSYSSDDYRTDRRTEIIDSTGRFKFDFIILHPQDVLLQYEEGYAILYVEASDSLYLKIRSTDFQNERFPNFIISGTNPNISREILAYKQSKNTKDFKPEIGNKAVVEYLEDIKQYIALQDSILSVFRKSNAPSSGFLNWAKKDMVYQSANYLIDFKFHHFINKTQFTGDLFDKDLFPVNDDNAIVSSTYGLHLWHYATDRYIQKDSTVMNLINVNDLSQAYTLCLSNIVTNEEAGISRDIMCYRILSALFEKSYEDFLSVWKSDMPYINNSKLNAILQNRKAEYELQENFSVSVLHPKTDSEKEVIGDFLTILNNEYKGKVVYLDIWATWCGPCRSEIPHAIELHQYFKNEPVTFVNLCMSSDKTEWKEAIKNQHINGDNYYFDKTKSGLMRNLLKWEGFPTYMIINKNGEIVDRSAPRPSSGDKIKVELTKYLKE